MEKILFVINPVAGNSKGHEVIPKINKYFHKSKYDIVITPKKGVTEEMVRKKVNHTPYRSVIAVGGDGTLMETLNGLIDYKGSVGIIPIGSGNDFAKTLGIAENIDESLKIIDKGYTKEIYSAWINGQRFLNVIGIGIDAMIIDYKERSKLIKGKLNYLIATIKGIFKYKATPLKVIIDAKEYNFNPLFIAIGNGKYIGNGMKITPHADLTSEKFEICIIGDLKKKILLKSITKLYKGLHGGVQGVEFLKGNTITIEFDQVRPVDVDGNLINCKSVNIKKSSSKIKFLVKG